MSQPVRVAGICFEHFHMGDNLRMVLENDMTELVGICDSQHERMRESIDQFGIPADRVFSDYRQCLQVTQPDLVILCPSASDHFLWVQRIMAFGADAMVEKPMAASLAEADQMIEAAGLAGKRLMINWPLAWSAPHQTARRLIQDGVIGQVLEVHYYDGNRGPLYHGADKRVTSAEEVAAMKPSSWFYSKAAGGGSLLDYLGYGTTLGTWFMNGRVPREVTAVVDRPPGLEVDEHCIAIARYATGLSKFETRWGTFTDPWTQQPQPACGFVIVGSEGTIGCYDYQDHVLLQTKSLPQVHAISNDPVPASQRDPIAFYLDCRQRGAPIDGPCGPEISRIGQQIVDAARISAHQGGTIRLPQG